MKNASQCLDADEEGFERVGVSCQYCIAKSENLCKTRDLSIRKQRRKNGVKTARDSHGRLPWGPTSDPLPDNAGLAADELRGFRNPGQWTTRSILPWRVSILLQPTVPPTSVRSPRSFPALSNAARRAYMQAKDRKEGGKLKSAEVASHRVIGTHMNVRVEILKLKLLA